MRIIEVLAEDKITNLSFACSLMTAVLLALVAMCVSLNAVEIGLSIMEMIPWLS